MSHLADEGAAPASSERSQLIRLGAKAVRTFTLQDGSIVKLIDVKAVRVHKHRWSDKYYVAIKFRGTDQQYLVEHLSREEADEKQAKVAGIIREAWEEVDAYEDGHQQGRGQGRSEGWSEGRSEGWSEGYENGRSEGYHVGVQNGHVEDRRYSLAVLFERREALMCEQRYADGLPPSRRRYLRDAISVLSDIIRELSPEPSPNPDP